MTTDDKKTPSPFYSMVGRMLSEFSRTEGGKGGVLSRGDISGLKRMDPACPSVQFWKLLAVVETENAPKNDRKWALVAKCMALMYPHIDAKISPGKALRDAGFSQSSDLRMARLLKAEGTSFEDYLISAVRYLAVKGVAINWIMFADFVFFQNTISKNRLAKDFYSTSKD